MVVILAVPGFLRSQRMQAAVREIEAAVVSGGDALISGEPGTGRESVARAIHRACNSSNGYSLDDLLRQGCHGPVGDAPFVVVDCAARDVEARVFGRAVGPNSHEDLDRVSPEGLLYQAFGGTIFLGSVDEMPGRVQTRLARVLRDGEVWVESPQGDPVLVPVTVRAIASIEPASADQEDDRVVPELRKRLAAHHIELPPLRQRREDIPGLIRIHLADICESLKLPVKAASSQTMALLSALPWRGNFKEMRALLRTLVLKAPGRLIRLSDVLDNIRLDGGAASFMGGGTLKEARERFEREYVAAVLEQHRGRMTEAARALGIQRTNLYRKVRQLAVQRKRPGNRG